MYPQFKVGINKEFDKIMCLKFIGRKKAGVDFGAGIIKVHPELTGIAEREVDAQKEIVSKYFDNFYDSNKNELEETRDKFVRDWNKVDPIFFKLCDKYFNKMSWPVGRYIGFLSIISCNPRFLEDKTFQVYWKNKKGFLPVAIHEMLHFIFYQSVLTYYPRVDIKSEEIWKISEVFNILILKQPDFIEITGDAEPSAYPDLLELQQKLDPIWESSKNIETFLKEVAFSKTEN